MARKTCVKLILVFFLSFALPSVNAGGDKRGTEIITGSVVAYDDVSTHFPCDKDCETSLIVRSDELNKVRAYIRIVVRYRSGKFPRELINVKAQWQFKITRTSQLDEPLYEYIEGEDVFGKAFKYPIWVRIVGAEKEALPFGATLASYSMAKAGFKTVKPEKR
jgi:hypothetical protein